VIYKVLIVDDSHFFQGRLKKIIDAHMSLQVVAIASSGVQAIEKEEEHRPDIITMDYEMPGMDGITALKAILQKRNVPILMFSSLTYEGATITLEALDAGAVDYIPKNFSEVTQGSEKLTQLLHKKLVIFAKKYASKKTFNQLNNTLACDKETTYSNRLSNIEYDTRKNFLTTSSSLKNKSINIGLTDATIKKGQIKLLVIGASTGGPVAVAEIITRLPSNFSIPIVIAQHMPKSFTGAFAARLNKISRLYVKEAKHQDLLQTGTVLIAPGGMQTMIDKSRRHLNIIEPDDRVPFKPSVDVLFGSAGNAFLDSVLGIVLTGMGRDGYNGAKIIRSHNGHIWSQDRQTSVIYGMPGAVESGNVTQLVLPLNAFYKKLIQLT